MKVIIAGSREFNNYELLCKRVDFYLNNASDDTTIISGGARGADQLGERYAKAMGYELEVFPADWSKHGKSAGYKRNELMASKATNLIAFWDGKSPGTKHMIDIAEKHGLVIRVVNYSSSRI